MSYKVREITQEVWRQLDQLEKLAPGGDWVDAWIEGDAIGTDEAAFIYGCSAQTVRRTAVAASLAGNPIGRQMLKSVWLISRRRFIVRRPIV